MAHQLTDVFLSEAKARFQFLADDYGYQLVEVNPSVEQCRRTDATEHEKLILKRVEYLKYKKNSTIIKIERDTYEYSIDITCDTPIFSFYMVNTLLTLSLCHTFDFVHQTSDVDELKKGIAILSEMLVKHFKPMLFESKEFAQKLKVRCNEKLMDTHQRDEMSGAWDARDFRLYCELATQIRGELTKSEKRKIEYAKSKFS